MGDNGRMSLPERLGRLERVGLLGSGGFATVWHYHDPELLSDVAVKVLADNWAQRTDVCDRFLEEARILRRTDSQHLVRVHDIGHHGDAPYFVMTYADRGSLADRVGTPMAPERAVELVEQAAAGLDVLHAAGVIHRDVKPHNLLLCGRGDDEERLLVADLGVAKAMAGASGLTQLVGTPAYMAPEQASGERLDARTDVFSLGAVATLLLTGSVAAPVPGALGVAVAGAMAHDPDDRYRSAGAFAQALRAAHDGRPVPPPGDGSGTPADRRASRLVQVLVLVAVLIGSFAAVYLAVGALR